MLTERKIPSKLEQIEQRYTALRFERLADIPMQMAETLEHFRQEPGPEANLAWQPAAPGLKWGDNWVSAWFLCDITLPESAGGRRLFLCDLPFRSEQEHADYTRTLTDALIPHVNGFVNCCLRHAGLQRHQQPRRHLYPRRQAQGAGKGLCRLGRSLEW